MENTFKEQLSNTGLYYAFIWHIWFTSINDKVRLSGEKSSWN